MADDGRVEVGEAYAYRVRGVDPLVPVELLKVGTSTPARVQVRFLDEEAEGRVDWVPPARLKCPWSEAATYQAGLDRWAALSSGGPDRDSPEHDAAWTVFESFLDRSIATMDWRAVGALRVPDIDALAEYLGWPVEQVSLEPPAFQDQGDWMLPWPVTEAVMRRFCELRAEKVLGWIDQEERRAAREAIYGDFRRGRGGGKDHHTSAEVCADVDREYSQPIRAVLREWCGSPARDRFDELAALRAEVLRLGELVERAIYWVRLAGHDREADALKRDLGIPVTELRADSQR